MHNQNFLIIYALQHKKRDNLHGKHGIEWKNVFIISLQRNAIAKSSMWGEILLSFIFMSFHFLSCKCPWKWQNTKFNFLHGSSNNKIYKENAKVNEKVREREKNDKFCLQNSFHIESCIHNVNFCCVRKKNALFALVLYFFAHYSMEKKLWMPSERKRKSFSCFSCFYSFYFS